MDSGKNPGPTGLAISSQLSENVTRPLLGGSTNPSGGNNTYSSTVNTPSSTGATSVSTEDDVPTNVSEPEQLKDLPEECLSGDPIRPLQHFDEDGKVCTYALNPMVYSVVVILLMEGLERFSFYGINYTQTSYLTGSYDRDWNAGMEAIPASSVRCAFGIWPIEAFLSLRFRQCSDAIVSTFGRGICVAVCLDFRGCCLYHALFGCLTGRPSVWRLLVHYSRNARLLLARLATHCSHDSAGFTGGRL
jgi:hypothetical protein